MLTQEPVVVFEFDLTNWCILTVKLIFRLYNAITIRLQLFQATNNDIKSNHMLPCWGEFGFAAHESFVYWAPPLLSHA